MFLASEAGSLETVKSLLENGASLEAAANDGWTPAFAASFKGNLEVLEALCEEGAQVSIFDIRGETPLHAAARNRCLK